MTTTTTKTLTDREAKKANPFRARFAWRLKDNELRLGSLCGVDVELRMVRKVTTRFHPSPTAFALKIDGVVVQRGHTTTGGASQVWERIQELTRRTVALRLVARGEMTADEFRRLARAEGMPEEMLRLLLRKTDAEQVGGEASR